VTIESQVVLGTMAMSLFWAGALAAAVVPRVSKERRLLAGAGVAVFVLAAGGYRCAVVLKAMRDAGGASAPR
jgi:hypothetical protein